MARRLDRRQKLGSHIRTLREKRGLSQAALARAAGNDLAQTDVSKIESGRRWPTVPQLAAMFRALGVPDASLTEYGDAP